MGRKSTAAAVALGCVSAAAVAYVVVATAKPKQGSWRYKFKTWLRIKWPLTHKWLTVFDPAPPTDPDEAVALMRLIMDSQYGAFTPKGKTVRCEDIDIPTRDGSTVKLRLHIPPSVKAHRVPVVLQFHGGGWVAGSIEDANTFCQVLAHDGPFIVASVDYRLSPEHKFPTPFNDCMDALRWVAQHVGDYNGDADNLAIVGDSAGGNLTMAVGVANSRDENGVPVRCLCAAYPAVCFDTNVESYEKYGHGNFPLTKGAMECFFHAYLDGSGAEPTDTRVSVNLEDSLAGLPPTQIITAEWDVLRDEGFTLVDKLKASKVSCTHVHYLRSTHGFVTYPTIGSGTDAMAELIAFIRAETAAKEHAHPTTTQETVTRW